MRTSLLASLILSMPLVTPVVAQAGTPPAVADDRPGPGPVKEGMPHYDLEVLYGEGRITDGLAIAKARLQANPTDPEIYRHVVRFMFETGELIDRNDKSVDKVALYKEMYELCNKALELDPGNPHLLFNRGVALGRLSTTRGVLSSVMNLKSVEQDWLAAANSRYKYLALADAEDLPCDTYLTLGMFYRLVPDWWIMGALAGTRGDIDKSIAWLEKADRCSPNRIRTVKELGVSQLCKGTKDSDADMITKGKATLSRLAAMPKAHTHSELDKAHAKKLMADPDLACEYSRDGQQEHDRKKLEEK